MKKILFFLSLLFIAFTSCVDEVTVDPEDDEEEYIDENEEENEEEENITNNWQLYATITGDEEGWGYYYDQNIVSNEEGKTYVLYRPQYSNTGGDNGYVAVITDSAEYTIEEFTPAVYGTFNMIETEMYQNTPYVAYFAYDNGYPEIIVKEKQGNSWTAVGGEVVGDYCDDEFDFAIGPNKDLFVAFGETNQQFDAVGKLTVRKYSNDTWTTLGQNQFSDSLASYLQLAVGSNNIPYVFYREVENTAEKDIRNTVVEYFDGSQWEKCGDYISTSENIVSMSIVVMNNVPYIAYSDLDAGKSYIKYWEGDAWNDLSLSLPYMINTKLQVFNNELYVGFNNGDDSNNIAIQKFTDSGIRVFDKDGIQLLVHGVEGFDFTVTSKGIFLLDRSSSKVIYHPF